MKPIMTKADLLKMLEPLSDKDIVQCQVNFTTNRTEEKTTVTFIRIGM